MDAATLYASGNVHFLNEEYEEAVKHFTCAVTLQDGAAHRAARSAAYLKLGRFQEALDDSAAATGFEPKCHTALHWRGVSLFYLGDYHGAKDAFESSIAANPTAKAPRQMWIRKCDAELSGSTLPLRGIAAEATRAASGSVAAAAPTDAAQEAPLAAAAAQPPAPAAAVPASSSSPAANDGLTISGRKGIKREWYQNNTTVFVTIFAKGVKEDQCKVDFQETELSVCFPLPGSDGEEYQLDLELFDGVEPSGCKIDVGKVKVEIALAKKTSGSQWKDLEKAAEAPMVFVPAQPAYPTSNRQKKDWSQIDKEVDAEMKAEKPAGDEALNSLFKQIYERADESTRRAMNKSFQTSGGTVLSTNWGEVSSADYEGKDRPTAPDGQKWAGDK